MRIRLPKRNSATPDWEDASERGDGGCLILFGIPFALVGVGMTWFLFTILAEFSATKSWVEVPAKILSARLDTRHGEDGPEHEALAEYEYEFGGMEYRNQRVSLNGDLERVGNSERNAAAELMRHLEKGKPFLARVDPDAPVESVLYADLNLRMVAFASAFGLMFGGIGFGVMIGGVVTQRAEDRERALRGRSPDAPWEWGEGWKEGRIVFSGRGKMWSLIAAAVFWNAITVPAMLVIGSEIAGGESAWAWLFLITPAIGLAILIGAIRQIIRVRKFGESVLELATRPGVVGGNFAGAILIPRSLRPHGGFVQRLRCEEAVTDEMGGESETRTRTLWEDERVLSGELLADDRTRSAVPVLFGIPFEQPQTEMDGDRKLTWTLKMEAAVSGVDYAAEFEVPVFVTDETDEAFVLDEAPVAALTLSQTVTEKLRRAGADVQESIHGLEISFPLLHNLAWAIALAAFTVAWIGIVGLIWKLGAPLFLVIIFALLAVLLVLGVLSAIFTNKCLRLGDTELVSHGGLSAGTKRFPYSELAEARAGLRFRSADHLRDVVSVRDKAGRSATLTPGLRPASTAHALAEEIRRRMREGV